MSQYATIITKSGGGELPPELDPQNEGLVYGNNLPKCWENLTSIANSLGVTPLTVFEWQGEDECGEVEYRGPEGVRSVADLLKRIREGDPNAFTPYEVKPEDYAAYVQPNEQDLGTWHDPRDGLRTVSCLLEFLSSGSSHTLKDGVDDNFPMKNLKWVIWDLRAYEMILKKACENSDPFRIEIC